MAPREKGSEKARRRRSHRPNRVRFHQQQQVVGAAKSAADVRPPGNYESLILYYLAKLKRLFSSGGVHKPPQQRLPEVRPPPVKGDDQIKDKVYNVVSAALEYGLANNVLERRGDYFSLRTRGQRIAARQATPGPRRVPSRYCSRCDCAARGRDGAHAPPHRPAEGAGAAPAQQQRRPPLSPPTTPCRCARCGGSAMAAVRPRPA